MLKQLRCKVNAIYWNIYEPINMKNLVDLGSLCKYQEEKMQLKEVGIESMYYFVVVGMSQN